jgi:hypothetical protein
MVQKSTRRRFVSASLVAIPAIELAAYGLTGAQEPEMVGSAQSPAWTFTVVSFQDPYTGEITRPQEPDPGTRYVSAQVIIANGSTEPLEFEIADVHLVDENGDEYPAGAVLGSEPKLVTQNLPDGERTRGWVWYEVPTGVNVTELRFYGPRPVFKVAVVAGVATPVAG